MDPNSNKKKKFEKIKIEAIWFVCNARSIDCRSFKSMQSGHLIEVKVIGRNIWKNAKVSANDIFFHFLTPSVDIKQLAVFIWMKIVFLFGVFAFITLSL